MTQNENEHMEPLLLWLSYLLKHSIFHFYWSSGKFYNIIFELFEEIFIAYMYGICLILWSCNGQLG